MDTNRPIKKRVLAAITAALAIILAACSSGATSRSSTITATVAPSASAAPSAAAGPIPDGTYVTKAIPIPTIVARINADVVLTAAQKAGYAQAFAGHKTEMIWLDFHAGQFTEREAFDGATPDVGARATFAFPDGQTLVIQEECCGLSTFVIAVRQDGFSLRYKAGAPNAGENILGQAAVYEPSPFTQVH